MDSRRIFAAFIGLGLLVALLSTPNAVAEPPDRPSRVIILVLDQGRPDTIERYKMANVQALMRGGANFSNAHVGHMAAETVIEPAKIQKR